MYVFEIEASDAYSVLGRVLDRSRVAGLRLFAVTMEETSSGYAIAVTMDSRDRDLVDRLAHQFAGMFGVVSVNVERRATHHSSDSALAATQPPQKRWLPGPEGVARD